MQPRLLIALVALSLVASSAALGWVAWITIEPRQWFSEAYAEQGPRGEEGPRGEPGPRGRAGPVGPEAEDAIGALESQLSDLEARLETVESDLDDLASGFSTTEIQAEVDDVASTVEEVASTVAAICDEFSYYEGALEEIWINAC